MSDAESAYQRGYLDGMAKGRRDAEGEWHQAVLNACMVRECCYFPDDPAKSLRLLMEWEVRVALDPAVSEQAQALVTRGGEGLYSMDEMRAYADAMIIAQANARRTLVKSLTRQIGVDQYVITKDALFKLTM